MVSKKKRTSPYVLTDSVTKESNQAKPLVDTRVLRIGRRRISVEFLEIAANCS